MTRTDEHRPSTFNPADYTWVGYSDDGDSHASYLTDGPLFHDAKSANPSGRNNEIHPGGCDTCGQMGLRYRHYYRHDPTGDVIVLGDQCVRRLDFDSNEAFAAKKRVELEQAKASAKAVADKWRAENPEFAAELATYADDHHILGDMQRKLNQYGSLSDKQVAFAQRLIEETRERLENPPEPEPDPEPIPAELYGNRVELTGVVLGTKTTESQWGNQFKMLFLDDRGFKLWGSVPSLGGPVKGARVSFVARVEASDDDPCFGFYSRPTKAQFIDEEEAA